MIANKPRVYEGQGSAIDDYNSPKQQLHNVVSGKSGNWGLFNKDDQQHKYVRSLCMQAQWTVPSEKWGEVADLNRLSDFLKSDKSPVNLPLNKMNPKEVSKVIIALEGIVNSKYKTKKRK